MTFFIFSRFFFVLFCFEVFSLRNTKIIRNYVLFNIIIIKYSSWFSVIFCLWFFCFYSALILLTILKMLHYTENYFHTSSRIKFMLWPSTVIHIHFLVFHPYFTIWKFNSKMISTLSPLLFPAAFDENQAVFFLQAGSTGLVSSFLSILCLFLLFLCMGSITFLFTVLSLVMNYQIYSPPLIM